MLVQGVDQRHPVGNLQMGDHAVVDVVHGLHEGTDGVRMCDDQHPLALEQAWGDNFLSVAECSHLALLKTPQHRTHCYYHYCYYCCY